MKVLTSDGLTIIYDEEIKNYIKNQGAGITADEVQNMINESDDGVKLSEDSTYEILETS